MQKGYKRERRGMAVLYCFIGLFFVIILILLGYFFLKLDYSDRLAPGTSMRPYVETTPTPSPTAVPIVTGVPVAEITATPTKAATAAPTIAPTQGPTTAPTAEPTASPEPTEIPDSEISPLKFKGFELPSLSAKNAKLGITHSFRSVADEYKYLHLQGYAYIDEAGYDGATADIYLVIIRSTGHTALALPVKSAGISGGSHASALCANANSSDFQAVIDVSQFPDDSYTLGMVFMYKDAESGETSTEYFTFPSEMSFSVLDKQVISDVKTVTAE